MKIKRIKLLGLSIGIVIVISLLITVFAIRHLSIPSSIVSIEQGSMLTPPLFGYQFKVGKGEIEFIHIKTPQPQDWDFIKKQERLEQLVIEGTNSWTDQISISLSNTSIHSLEFRSCKFESDEPKITKELHSIKKLIFDNCSGKLSLEDMNKFPDLEFIVIYFNVNEKFDIIGSLPGAESLLNINLYNASEKDIPAAKISFSNPLSLRLKDCSTQGTIYLLKSIDSPIQFLEIKNSDIDDRHISKDFSEIFDATENIVDLGTLFIDARVKQGLTQEDVSKILKVRVSAVKQIERGEELESLGSAYSLGFLRSYAKLVDLDPENIIKNYKSSNSEKNIKFDYNFPSVTKEKKSLLPVMALCTFLFSLVIYSSWYYLNINNLETENKNITYLDNDNNNLDYVKIEDNKNTSPDNTDKINSQNLVTSEKETTKIRGKNQI